MTPDNCAEASDLDKAAHLKAELEPTWLASTLASVRAQMTKYLTAWSFFTNIIIAYLNLSGEQVFEENH